MKHHWQPRTYPNGPTLTVCTRCTMLKEPGAPSECRRQPDE